MIAAEDDKEALLVLPPQRPELGVGLEKRPHVRGPCPLLPPSHDAHVDREEVCILWRPHRKGAPSERVCGRENRGGATVVARGKHPVVSRTSLSASTNKEERTATVVGANVAPFISSPAVDIPGMSTSEANLVAYAAWCMPCVLK